jgi:hypothetical protein
MLQGRPERRFGALIGISDCSGRVGKYLPYVRTWLAARVEVWRSCDISSSVYEFSFVEIAFPGLFRRAPPC